LKYLRGIKAKEVFSKYIQIDIDFIDRPASHDAVGKYVYSEIENQLRDRHNITITDDNMVRGVLHFDLERFKRSPEGKLYPPDSIDYKREELKYIRAIRDDAHEFLRRVIHHMRAGRQFSIAIFFDNLDRRTPEIQEEAFLRASAIARDWASLVFVCLRPDTYYRSKSDGVLDSVAPKVVNIVSPRTSLMVSRRLSYVKRYAQGERVPTVRTKTPFGRQTSFDLPTVTRFLEICANSFRRSKKLAAIFEAASNGNARELLAYVYQTLTSLHLNTAKILEHRGTSYTIGDHEAIRALLYKDGMHYEPTQSVFMNLFDIQRADPLEHFTRYLALDHLCKAPESVKAAYGFESLDSVLRYLAQIGYSEEHAMGTIRHLFERKCCEARIPQAEWNDKLRDIKITSLGRYQATVLVKTFSYMDAITVDTPILDDIARKEITDVVPIEARLSRCDVFISYLNKCSEVLQDAKAQELWRETYKAVKADIRLVQKRVEESKRRERRAPR